MFWIETYMEYFNLMCADKDMEWLTSFIHDVLKQGKPHQDLEMNMCIHVRNFRDRSCTFYLKSSHKSFFLYF